MEFVLGIQSVAWELHFQTQLPETVKPLRELLLQKPPTQRYLKFHKRIMHLHSKQLQTLYRHQYF